MDMGLRGNVAVNKKFGDRVFVVQIVTDFQSSAWLKKLITPR